MKLQFGPGECPSCGKNELDYGDMGIQDNDLFYLFTCRACGITGREWYALEWTESEIIESD